MPVPFGVKSSQFQLGATLQYHLNQQVPQFEQRRNTTEGEHVWVLRSLRSKSDHSILQSDRCTFSVKNSI